MPQRPQSHHAPRTLARHEPEMPPRLSPSRRGYGSRWQRLALLFKRDHSFCADPFGFHAADGRLIPAAHVDHIVARSAGGSDDWSNLQALCARCHSRKTVLQDGGFGRDRPVKSSQGSAPYHGWPVARKFEGFDMGGYAGAGD